MSEHLSKEVCEPCSLGTPSLNQEEINTFIKDIHTEWKVLENTSLMREFKFKNFKDGLAFVDQVGELAEQEGHHPDVELGWGRVVIRLTTHKIHGLSKNDFILASKIDQLTK